MNARITESRFPRIALLMGTVAGLLVLSGWSGLGGPGGSLPGAAFAQSGTPAAAPAPAPGDASQAAPAAVALPVRSPATPEELAQGQALLARAVQETFIGKPSDLRVFSWSDSGTFYIGQEAFPLRTVNVLIPAHCYWTEQLLPMGVISMAYCDGFGWSKAGNRVRDLVESDLKSESRARQMDLLRVLVDATKLKAKPIADTVLSAGPAAGLFVDDEQVLDWRLYMDKKTGRIVRSDYLEPSPMGGPPARHAFEFHDYQPVDELVRWPTLLSKSVNGTKYFDLTLRKAACNEKTDSALFDKPKE